MKFSLSGTTKFSLSAETRFPLSAKTKFSLSAKTRLSLSAKTRLSLSGRTRFSLSANRGFLKDFGLLTLIFLQALVLQILVGIKNARKYFVNVNISHSYFFRLHKPFIILEI